MQNFQIIRVTVSIRGSECSFQLEAQYLDSSFHVEAAAVAFVGLASHVFHFPGTNMMQLLATNRGH